MHFVVLHTARSMAEIFPNLAAVPTPLKDQQIADLSGVRVDKFGFSFQVPWTKQTFDRTFTSMATVNFDGGSALLLDSPRSEVRQLEVLRSLNAHDRAALTSVLGAKAMSSNYEFVAAEMEITPSEAKWWSSRKSYERTIVLLGDKGADLDECTSIHPVLRGAMRGFQFGDPDVAPYRVNLELFDSLDREYVIRIITSPERGPVITQAQINALIASFVPLPAPTRKSTSASGI